MPIGGETPDLNEVPCVACGEPVPADEVVWDAWHTGDRRFAALPYHRRCAASILPPDAPDAAMSRCGRCGMELTPEARDAAYAALVARFGAAKGSVASPEVVWRLAAREPRRYAPEHFACVLAALAKPPPALGGEVGPEQPGNREEGAG